MVIDYTKNCYLTKKAESDFKAQLQEIRKQHPTPSKQQLVDYFNYCFNKGKDLTVSEIIKEKSTLLYECVDWDEEPMDSWGYYSLDEEERSEYDNTYTKILPRSKKLVEKLSNDKHASVFISGDLVSIYPYSGIGLGDRSDRVDFFITMDNKGKYINIQYKFAEISNVTAQPFNGTHSVLFKINKKDFNEFLNNTETTNSLNNRPPAPRSPYL